MAHKRPPKPKLVIRKYRGDDTHSWAVFAVGNPTPVVTGCTRDEARSHKVTLESMYASRCPSQAFEPDS